MPCRFVYYPLPIFSVNPLKVLSISLSGNTLYTTLIAVLVLSNWGAGSYLKLDRDAVEVLYQSLGFLLAGLAIWFGIRLGMREVVLTGATFFVIFLYIKFFDWWWDWMPKYLFFLIMGLIAIGLLFVLSRARRMLQDAGS